MYPVNEERLYELRVTVASMETGYILPLLPTSTSAILQSTDLLLRRERRLLKADIGSGCLLMPGPIKFDLIPLMLILTAVSQGFFSRFAGMVTSAFLCWNDPVERYVDDPWSR